jgi:hypothetical protein
MPNKRNVVLYLDKEIVEKTRELGFNLRKKEKTKKLKLSAVVFAAFQYVAYLAESD